MKIGEKSSAAASEAAKPEVPAEPAPAAAAGLRFGTAEPQRKVSASGLKRLGTRLAGTATKRARPETGGASGSGQLAAAPRAGGAQAQGVQASASGDAAATSSSGKRQTQTMTAAKLARALAILAEDPLRPRRDVAADIGVGDGTLNYYIGAGGKLNRMNTVLGLPDFAAHGASIKTSLDRLRHDDQAAQIEAAGTGARQGAERRTYTAGDILQFLLDHEAGTGAKDNITKRWTSASSWRKENLAARVATYDGYADVRTEIEAVAKRIGIIGADEHLPATPAPARRAFDAQMLVKALRQIRDRKVALAAGRDNDPSVKQALHVGAGTNKNMLSAWVGADGRLKKPIRAVSRLPGYEGVQPELKQLLTELEFGELAAQLPDSALAKQTLGAEQIANALVMMADDPARSSAEIALSVGILGSVLSEFVGRDGTCKNLDRLANLPGYDDHVATMREALTRMQRGDQAALLPAPRSSAEGKAVVGDAPGPSSHAAKMTADEFLRKAEAHLPQVVEVARLVRDDPSLGLWNATASAHVSKALIRVFFDDRGTLRDAPAIAQKLGEVDAHASASIEQLMARLHKRLGRSSVANTSTGAGASSSAGRSTRPFADARMKPLRIEGTGRSHDRVLIVDRKTVDPGPNVKGRRDAIYAQNPSLVHGPRSYEPDRQRQPLRWLSTVLKAHFDAEEFAKRGKFALGSEVQCAFDAASGTIVVSSNKVTVNKAIRDFLHSGGLERLLNEPMPKYEGPSAARISGHHAKLATRMNPAADPHLGSASDAVLAAIAERRFRVPTKPYMYDRKEVDLHAERRIKDFLRTKMRSSIDPANLAGTARPCGTCSDEIGADRNAHRGPFWTSGAATAGIDVEASIERHVREGMGTSTTRTAKGTTFAHDTDSDSDA